MYLDDVSMGREARETFRVSQAHAGSQCKRTGAAEITYPTFLSNLIRKRADSCGASFSLPTSTWVALESVDADMAGVVVVGERQAGAASDAGRRASLRPSES